LCTSSPEETIHLGKLIGAELKPGMVIGLCGELGTGKTRIWDTKSISTGMG